MNIVVLVGRLTKPPELRYSQQGVGVANFTLAVDRAYKNAQGEKEADFINCVAFDRGNYKLAEYLGNDLQKGQQVTVRGSIRVRTYDGQDGAKKWVTEVVVDEARYAKPKQDNRGDAWEPPPGQFRGGELPPEEDIPF
ncbi:MAG: single-stranded DNA-binding protein [Clostridia bacterium]|nr:single-stranded DNA-binding protein [Clostridia bacterium]